MLQDLEEWTEYHLMIPLMRKQTIVFGLKSKQVMLTTHILENKSSQNQNNEGAIARQSKEDSSQRSKSHSESVDL